MGTVKHKDLKILEFLILFTVITPYWRHAYVQIIKNNTVLLI